jgi:hypothetical protein
MRRVTRDPSRLSSPAAARTKRSELETSIEDRLSNAQGQGAALEPHHRQQLESRLGHQFSHVRVHADAAADDLARDLEARAFAVGDDVFFRSGEFDPDTPSGLQLLAHEGAHTLQPGAAEGPLLPRPDAQHDTFEREADAMGDAVLDPSTAPPSALSASPGAQVQLWPWSDDDASKSEPDDGFFGGLGGLLDSAGSSVADTFGGISNAASGLSDLIPGFGPGGGGATLADVDARQGVMSAGPTAIPLGGAPGGLFNDLPDWATHGGAGLVWGGVQGLVPGGFAIPSPNPKDKNFEAGRGIGQMVSGVGQMAVGGGLEIGGLALDATGVGAVLGIPANIVGAGLILNGGASTVAGAGTLVNSGVFATTGGGGDSPYRKPGERDQYDDPVAQPRSPGPSSIELAERNVQKAQAEVMRIRKEMNNTPGPQQGPLRQQLAQAEEQLRIAEQNLEILRAGKK